MTILAMNSVDTALFCSYIHYNRTVRFKGIKRVENGLVVAMVGFDDWTHNSVQMHVWTNGSKRALTRRFLQEVFWYAFVTCKLGIVITVVACNNDAALRLTAKAGFRRLLTVKDGYALGTDLAIQEMRREECRWLSGVPNGRQERRTSST